jgi:6-phosphogluconolactonase/glucosamine-6-phosphate isomerase/deaminase
MYRLLGELDVDWGRTEVFQVDERVAPDGSPDRNLTHLLESLPEPARDRVRPMPVGNDDLEHAADEYAELLPERLDLVHLGIGPDGHTASLVPGDPDLEVTDRRVTASGDYQGHRRLTLTYPELERARKLLWLITGESKREPLGWLLANEGSIPAGRVENEDSLVIADRAATGR